MKVCGSLWHVVAAIGQPVGMVCIARILAAAFLNTAEHF
jgi:hypothetical protein